MRWLFVFVIVLFQGLPTLAKEAVTDFPYPLVAVVGEEAFDRWRDLQSEPGTAIILGSLEEVENISSAFDPVNDMRYGSQDDVWEKADRLVHPQSLFDHRVRETEESIAILKKYSPELLEDWGEFDPLEIPDDYWGPWPTHGLPADELISLDHWETGTPPETVYITILPTEKPWEAPAYLRFGGWNANPAPEIHVALLRQWFEEYGAVPVVMQSDIIEVYAANPPQDRNAARELAREQYTYCEDIVIQGVGDMSVLAALVKERHFWYFWWD